MISQKGSAHVILVGAMAVALLGALGFIFWQNFVQKEEVASSEVKTVKDESVDEKTVEPEKVDNTNLYDGSTYSFRYPNQGWLVVEVRNDYDPNNAVNPELQTSDYSPSVGMGIDKGAKVSVYTTNNVNGVSLAQDKENMSKSMPLMENVKDTTLGGVPAYSYSSGYEGYRYTTIAIKGSTYYQIDYQYAGDDQSVHRNGYDTLVSTFKFK